VANFKSETVGQQITKVTGLVKKSHVQQFGDMSKIGKEVIGAFEGAEASSMGIPMVLNTSWAQSDHDSDSAVNSRDIEVHLAYYKLKNAETIQQRRDAETKLAALLGMRRALDAKFISIAMLVVDGDEAKAAAMIDGDLEELGNVACHTKALEVVVENCGPLNDYTMRYSRLFANICNTVASKFVNVDKAIKDVCKKSEIVV